MLLFFGCCCGGGGSGIGSGGVIKFVIDMMIMKVFVIFYKLIVNVELFERDI